MTSLLNRWIRAAEAPLLLIVAFLFFWLLYHVFNLPSVVELAKLLREFFALYGVWVVLVAAIIESIFMVNFYFPGSFVIVLSVAVSEKTITALAPIVIAVWIGFVLATIINYEIGKYGVHKFLLKLGRKNLLERAHRCSQRYGTWAPFLAAVHPNFLALVVVNRGVADLGLLRTLIISAVANAAWVLLWTIFVSLIVRDELIEGEGQQWFILGAFAAWAIYNIAKDTFFRKRTRDKQ